MSNQSFFFINDEPISQDQVLEYLESAGKLEEFLEEVLSQHAIALEFRARPELLPAVEVAEQLMADFRTSRDLDDPAVFESWLQSNGSTLDALEKTLQRQWSMQQLVQHISQPKLYEYFIRRKPQLDQIWLSSIIVQTEMLASELYEQIKEGTPFEQLAQHHSLTNQENGGKLPPLARESLPDDLRVEVEAARPRDLIGPLQLEGGWCLFRLEKIVPAALEGETQNQLQIELFQQWLTDQVAAMTVKMEVSQWLYL